MTLQILYKAFIILIITSIVVAQDSENNNLEKLSDAPSDAEIGIFQKTFKSLRSAQTFR